MLRDMNRDNIMEGARIMNMHAIHTPLQKLVFDIDKVVGWKFMTQSQILEVYCEGIQPITLAGTQALETDQVLSQILTSPGQRRATN